MSQTIFSSTQRVSSFFFAWLLPGLAERGSAELERQKQRQKYYRDWTERGALGWFLGAALLYSLYVFLDLFYPFFIFIYNEYIYWTISAFPSSWFVERLKQKSTRKVFSEATGDPSQGFFFSLLKNKKHNIDIFKLLFVLIIFAL